MAESRHLKIVKSHNSSTVRLIATKFGTRTHLFWPF